MHIVCDQKWMRAEWGLSLGDPFGVGRVSHLQSGSMSPIGGKTLLNTVYSLHNTRYGILSNTQWVSHCIQQRCLIQHGDQHGDHMEHQMPRKLILICSSRTLPNKTRLRRLYDYRPSHWVAWTARSRPGRAVRPAIYSTELVVQIRNKQKINRISFGVRRVAKV